MRSSLLPLDASDRPLRRLPRLHISTFACEISQRIQRLRITLPAQAVGGRRSNPALRVLEQWGQRIHDPSVAKVAERAGDDGTHDPISVGEGRDAKIESTWCLVGNDRARGVASCWSVRIAASGHLQSRMARSRSSSSSSSQRPQRLLAARHRTFGAGVAQVSHQRVHAATALAGESPTMHPVPEAVSKRPPLLGLDPSAE